MNNTSTVDVLTEQAALWLAERLHAQLEKMEWFTASTYPGLRSDLLTASLTHVGILRQRQADNPFAAHTARHICDMLFGDCTVPNDFWQTVLGADVAWHIGHPRDTFGYETVMAVLGCSRQMVYKFASTFKVEIFTAAGLRDAVRTWPLWRDAANLEAWADARAGSARTAARHRAEP